MDASDDLAERLRESVGNMVRATRNAASGLAAAHAATLGSLDRIGPMTIAELARRRNVKHQGQSRTVIELEARGYVERTTSVDDARASVIAIAEAGRSALMIDRRARASWLASAIRAELDDDERELLARMPDLVDRLTASYTTRL